MVHEASMCPAAIRGDFSFMANAYDTICRFGRISATVSQQRISVLQLRLNGLHPDNTLENLNSAALSDQKVCQHQTDCNAAPLRNAGMKLSKKLSSG
jgi:hypothetical protein